MIYYLYPVLASILIGLRMVSYKAMVLDKKYFYSLLVFVIFTIVASQYFIYKAMEYFENPTIVNLIVYFSVFITFFASIYIFKISDFEIHRFLFGLFLIIVGLYFINTAYN